MLNVGDWIQRERGDGMSRLDDVISDVAYILDTLMVYRQLIETGCCNDCGKRSRCSWIPDPGGIVRYNCPFHEEKRGDT